MKYNYLSIKDKSKRYKYNKFEPIKLVLKSICYNRDLNEDLRFFFFSKLNSCLKDSSSVRIKNRCVITNRSHSVLRVFKLSRITFREYIGKNFIQGIRKSSW